MLTIYGVYRSRASRNYWMAGELGLAVRSVPVIQARRLIEPEAADAPLNTRSPAFLAINPIAQIPAIDDDGLILTESLAINLYLARKHGSPLSPADVTEDGQMLAWTLWAATEVEPNALKIMRAADAGPQGAPRGRAVLDAAVDAITPNFARLEAHLAQTGHVVGDRFTVADLNLAEVFRYAQSRGELFARHPAVSQWLARCQDRPAFKAVMALRAAEPE